MSGWPTGRQHQGAPMPHHSPLVSTIVVGLVLAFAFGAVAHRLKASPLVGYLLAGVIIGPFTPGFVADQAIANELAEIGIILLMFGVGLQFSLHELLSVRAIAVPGAIVQIAVATALGAALGLAARLAARRRADVRRRALGRQHRGGAAHLAGAPPARHRTRPHRGRLADRRGPRDGAGAGVRCRPSPMSPRGRRSISPRWRIPARDHARASSPPSWC